MGQSGMTSVQSGNLPPSVATSYVTNSGTAIPVANVLNVLATYVAAGTTPVGTIGSGNTVTVNVQLAQTNASSNVSLAGLASFNSAQFTVDANGFVSTSGSTTLQFTANSGTAVPVAGNINVLGAVVIAGTTPVATIASGSTVTVNVQRAQANAISDGTKIGLAVFNSAQFTVDANGFVTIISGGFTWVDVTVATQTLAAETGYVTDRGGGVVYTLPASAVLGDTIKIVGKAGLATITPNANQQLLFSSASGTVGVTGTAVATNAGDCVELICVTAGASAVFRAASFVGNWTIT